MNIKKILSWISKKKKKEVKKIVINKDEYIIQSTFIQNKYRTQYKLERKGKTYTLLVEDYRSADIMYEKDYYYLTFSEDHGGFMKRIYEYNIIN